MLASLKDSADPFLIDVFVCATHGTTPRMLARVPARICPLEWLIRRDVDMMRDSRFLVCLFSQREIHFIAATVRALRAKSGSR